MNQFDALTGLAQADTVIHDALIVVGDIVNARDQLLQLAKEVEVPR